MTPILTHIDKLQILRRDKHKFEVKLLPKDLKYLPKDRKEECLNAKSYLDSEENKEKLLLIIDLNLPNKLASHVTTDE